MAEFGAQFNFFVSSYTLQSFHALSGWDTMWHSVKSKAGSGHTQVSILTVPLTVGHVSARQITGVNQLEVPHIRVIVST